MQIVGDNAYKMFDPVWGQWTLVAITTTIIIIMFSFSFSSTPNNSIKSDHFYLFCITHLCSYLFPLPLCWVRLFCALDYCDRHQTDFSVPYLTHLFHVTFCSFSELRVEHAVLLHLNLQDFGLTCTSNLSLQPYPYLFSL